jgi:ribonucleotide reductase alpha subunit
MIIALAPPPPLQMPATPILSNGGTERGLPISCNLNKMK